MCGLSKKTERATTGLIFLSVLAVIGTVLPIVVAIILSNLWEQQIINADINIQLWLLLVGLIILISIDVFLTVKTVGLKRFEPK